MAFETVLSYMAFRFSLANFLICGLGNRRILRICDLRINHYKFADLRFADWNTMEICGSAICGLIITNLRICDVRTGTPQKFADLRLYSKHKNLGICGLTKKIKFPPFALEICTRTMQHNYIFSIW